MPFALISHMMQEYSSMMNTDDDKASKNKDREIKLPPNGILEG